MYKVVLVSSILCIVAGLMFTGFALFSPLWQIIELPNQYVTHQHGLWWDCIVSTSSNERIISLSDIQNNHRVDKCASKFEESTQEILRTALEANDDASQELLLHRFLPHHKGVVFFTVFVFVFGGIAVVIGACSPCFPPNSLLFVVATFMTTACSVFADIIFLFASERTDDDIVAHQRLGLACYLHIVASCTFVAALILSAASAYLLIMNNKGYDGCCLTKQEYALQNNWPARSTSCRNGACRPFVVDEDSL